MSTAASSPRCEANVVPQPALIAIDWGSSSFRAYLVTRDGETLANIATADGVGSIAPGGFPDAFRRLASAWLDAHPALPVLMSGMVGSRNGWREAPYASCPVDARAIAEKLAVVEADGRRVFIVPGLVSGNGASEPDVMRGEEVEILGIAEAGASLVVLPGSHSKWAAVADGRIERFRTFVTGELFAAIRDHTLIGAFARNAPAGPPGQAFARGVRRGAEAARSDGLLGALFGARSLPLRGRIAEADAGDYLSGLLVGAEIAEARRLFPDGVPTLVGAAPLVERYRAAFEALGERSEAAKAHAAPRGLALIARQAGLT
jgi:2-dehydro-3-deoxygalactonokinase